MKSVLLAGFALGVMLAFSSCNTVSGIGKDFQSVGHGIQRGADWCTPE